jgi:intracellular septation protein
MEYIPLIAFFIVYKMVDIYWAAGALVGGMALMMLITLALKKPIKKSTVMIFIFAVVMAGLTIAFRDEDFLKWKFTILYGIFGIALLVSRYMMNANLIKKSMESNFALPEPVWDKVNVAWSFFFLFCAGLNIYIFNNWSLDSWVNFKVFGVTGLMFVYLIGTVFYIYPHLPDEDKE